MERHDLQYNNVRVNVLVPNFNYGKYLDDAIQGIVEQTVKPSMVTIVDDGSTDDSVETIKDKYLGEGYSESELNLGKEYDGFLNGEIPIKLIALAENGGPSRARNVGIKRTHECSDFFAMCDSDDIYYPTKIEESLKAFKAVPHATLVYSDYDVKNTQTGSIKREFKEPFSYKRLISENIVSTNPVISANIFNHVGLYDEKLRVAEDYDLWLRISESSIIYHIPKNLFQYRVTGEGATFSVDQETWKQCWSRVQQKVMQRRGT